MKSVWVEGSVQRYRRSGLRTAVLWVLEIGCLALFGAWVFGLASGQAVAGWRHEWLAAAVVTSFAAIFMNFRYAEYLGPTMFRWRRGSRLLHTRPAPTPPQGGAPTEEETRRG